MINLFKLFINSEDGAVTVDWVVLTAAIVGLAVAVIIAMQAGTLGLTGDVGEFFATEFFQEE